MTHKAAIQLVNVRTLKIVKLLTFEAEDRVACDHADKDAFAVEYIALHDQPPIEVPHGKGCAYWVTIARQIALSAISPSPSARARPGGGWPPIATAGPAADSASHRLRLPQ